MSDTVYFFVNNGLSSTVNDLPAGYTVTHNPVEILRNLLAGEGSLALPVLVNSDEGLDIPGLQEFLSDSDSIYQQVNVDSMNSTDELDCAIERLQEALSEALTANTYTVQQLVSNTVSSHYEPIPGGEFYSEKAAIAGMNELIRTCGFTNLIVTDGNDNVIADSADQ